MSPRIIDLFQNARHIVFLTGAGISTPSGIPDYRSPHGLYQKSRHGKHPTEWYLSHDCLTRYPKTFHRFMVKYMYHPDAQPNVIHRVQANLTRKDRAVIITQNVDDLYRKADVNSARLIEFHGNVYRCRCLKCHQAVDWRRYMKSPYHQSDHGIVRPEIVLYGENLIPKRYRDSIKAMLRADMIVIVGTTMKVEPFADLIKYHQPHVPIIAVNQQPLHFSYNVGLIMIQTDAVRFFKDLGNSLKL